MPDETGNLAKLREALDDEFGAPNILVVHDPPHYIVNISSPRFINLTRTQKLAYLHFVLESISLDGEFKDNLVLVALGQQNYRILDEM